MPYEYSNDIHTSGWEDFFNNFSVSTHFSREWYIFSPWCLSSKIFVSHAVNKESFVTGAYWQHMCHCKEIIEKISADKKQNVEA